MIRAALLAAAVALAGCDRAQPPMAPEPQRESPRPAIVAPTADVEALAADPQRLKAVRAACKADPSESLSPLCQAAAEATRRRFLGKSRAYEARPVEPFAAEPKATAP